jgi:hypothetical protein
MPCCASGSSSCAATRYAYGLSEAQWTSLVVVAVLWALGFENTAALIVLVAWASITIVRRRPETWSPLDPRHARSVAACLGALAADPRGPTRVAATSGGLRLSAGRTGDRLHFTCSRSSGLSEADAAEVAAIAAGLSGDPAPECVRGVAGTYHVVVAAPR